MPFEIIRHDITKVRADAIVNTANPYPVVGVGTDLAIYQAAGYDEMLKERQKIGEIARGEVAVTLAYRLKAKYVFHTVGPVWMGGGFDECEIMASCYHKSLLKAVELGCKSIAFPLISTGCYGFPKDRALQIALSTIQAFLTNHKLKVTLVVFNAEAYELSGNIFEGIQSFVDEHYVEDRLNRYRYGWTELAELTPEEDIPLEDTGSLDIDFDHLFENGEKTFQEKLFELIDARGIKDSYVYNQIHMSRAFFSKLRMDRYYQPTKKTVLAIAIVLKLDITETKDLLERAGLALSRSNKFDVILEACICRGLYDINDIELILIKNNLDTLRKYK